MVQKINVFYEGWGERFHWATLGAADLRSPVIFEYTEAAFQRGLELSPYLLPLQRGRDFSKVLFQHQMGLPGPAYDSLPDGWGLLLMDRLFRQRGLEPSRLSVLDRLAYIGNTAMGAMAFESASGLDASEAAPIPLEQLAREVQLVLEDKDTALLKQLALVGGSPHGARPKALVYIDTKHQRASTVPMQEGSPWLVKFPAMHEPSEVCAIEDLYCKSARRCGIDVPETLWMDLGGDLSAFGIQRFDREGGHKVPIHTLAAFAGADFRQPASIGYSALIQATRIFTKDVREVHKAFGRAVFNVIFNNRDDHGKNFSYRMRQDGTWKLSPAYDLTFNRGPNGYHQMDVAGEALTIRRSHLQRLGAEAQLSSIEVDTTIDRVAQEASMFLARVSDYQGIISTTKARDIAAAIGANTKAALS